MAQTFDLYSIKFHFIALEPLQFPVPASNLFRGAFGSVLHRTSPHLYQRIFAPGRQTGPSGLSQPPRPFVFRTRDLDGNSLNADDRFAACLNLFIPQVDVLSSVIEALAELAREGMGPTRSRLQLASVSLLKPDMPYHEFSTLTESPNYPPPLSLPLTPANDHTVNSVRIAFLTPTEIKSAGELLDTLEFPPLIQRVLERLSTLRSLYGAGPLELDFPALLNRAMKIRLIRQELEHVALNRINRRKSAKSADARQQAVKELIDPSGGAPSAQVVWWPSRALGTDTGPVLRESLKTQIHPLGGFLGEADYEGDLTAFVPFLRVAQFTGVGRQTVWGKGEISVREL